MRKLKELIEQLRQYNQEAEVSAIIHGQREDFTLTHGSSEGATKETCEKVYLYVDRLNSDEY
jgi:translation initiation factor 2B subunit (eIF-2B alpha/beta/delta family)